MGDALPSSIVTYLEEAGFSPTEIMILRCLLENDALSLREIAIKTGKSTGVLDQAMKKLLKKGIITKETINGNQKYTLHSLQAVRDWMEEDMKQKREMLLRKQKDFDAFITSLSRSKDRPDMQYFEGAEGVQQAYMELLNRGKQGEEMLHYFPVTRREEDDPLRAFRVQYFRYRHHRGIFSRVLAHDTPLGRRFQSRDPFEYRKTVLLSPEEYPFIFEQILINDTIACFDHASQKACFIHYPQHTAAQRLLFENLWRVAESGRSAQPSPSDAVPDAPHVIPMRTRTFSALREFFLSRRSLAVLVLSALLSGGITFALYERNMNLNLQRIRERAQSIAATGVLDFDPKDIDALQVEEDWKKPQWAKVVNQLIQIRVNNQDVFFAYIFRKDPTDPQKIQFVSDSHSMNPYANTDDDPYNNVDLDHDGAITKADLLQWPGQPYPDAPKDSFRGFTMPTATARFYTDSWGTFVSGYAPIKDNNGTSIAVFAVDIKSTKIDELSNETFTPFLYFLLFFFLFLLIRLTAFNQPLLRELLQVLRIRSLPFVLLLAAGLSAAVTYGLFLNQRRINFQRIQEQVKSIAATGAFQFDASDINALQVEEDWKKLQWAKVVRQLIHIRESNENVIFAYIMRRSPDDPNQQVFVADADSINPYAKIDLNRDGLINEKDLLSWPGQIYTGEPGALFDGFERPTADHEFYSNQWGTFISGYAPIRDEAGASIAVLGVDVRAEKLTEMTFRDFHILISFVLFFFLFLFIEIISLNPDIFRYVLGLFSRKRVLQVFLLLSIASLTATVGMYFYVLRAKENEVGMRLMSIAATAAPRFSPDDLNVLHVKDDMKRPEYQKVFRTLNEIRQSNRGIMYAYIWRPTDKKGIWEFVADADSNVTLPFLWRDFNSDGKLDKADENVWPGLEYNIEIYSSQIFRYGMNRPIYSIGVDQWGTFVTGSAPISDNKNSTVAVLGIDMNWAALREKVYTSFFSAFMIEFIFLATALMAYILSYCLNRIRDAQVLTK